MIDGILKWSIKSRWLVVILAGIMAACGFVTTSRIAVDVFPEFAPVQVVVLTEAPGFAPEEVESLITIPLETAVNGTARVKLVRSVSTVGLSVITVIFQDGTDIFTARQLVSEKLQIVRNKLPASINQPFLAPITTSSGDILKLGLYTTGDTSLLTLRTLVDWTVKMRLMSVTGVSNVVVYGGDQKQYQVLVDPKKLRQYDISLKQVIEATGGSNINCPGGFLRTRDDEYLIRGIGRVSSPAEVGGSVVTTRGNTPITLDKVATVRTGSAFKIGDAIVNGKPGVVLTVFKQPWANTLDTTRALEQAMKELEPGLPGDVRVATVFRQADFIEVAVRNVIEAILIGGALVVIVLFVFLQNWRTAAISLTAIPLSLLAAIIALKWQGGTINTMTLGGLAIAIGEVVDDAIIDVENVYRRLRENKQSANPRAYREVVFSASREVRGSVVYATFIVALVFLPVFTLGGMEGKIFSPLGFTYITALLASLVVALTVTPALCCLLLPGTRHLKDREPAFVELIKTFYLRVLKFSLSKPLPTVITAFALFVISLLPLAVMGREFLPQFDENNLIVTTVAKPGTSLHTTTQTGIELTKHLVGQHSVLAAAQRAGRAEGGEDYGAGNFSEFDIRLKPDTKLRGDLLYHVRSEFGAVPGLAVNTGSYLSHRMDHALSGINAAIAVKLFGPDLSVLHTKAREIERLMKTVDGATDVQVEPIIPVPDISIKIDRRAAASYGITVRDLSNTIEAAFNGVAVSQVLEGQKTFDLVVWFEPSSRNNLDVIRSTLVDTPAGAKIPIGALAQVSFGTSANTISHEGVSRRVVIQANITGRDLGSIIEDIRKKIDEQVKLPSGYYVRFGGQFEAQEQATSRLISFSLLAVIGIFALLLMAFQSMRSACLVMVNLPLAWIGGIWAVFFSGAVIGIGSLVGFITLFGISTRNGIMLVSHFNQLKKEGMDFHDVLLNGCLDRLVPVLMTALTAALGVAPIAILGGAGRELEQPLAIVIVGGMFSSTLLTLIVIPALFKLVGEKALQPFEKSEEDICQPDW